MRHTTTALVMVAAISLGGIGPLTAETAHYSKDTGPAGACDGLEKSSAAWTACIGVAAAGMPDGELFYAGYWLAKTGRYAEALGYLTLAKQKDERVLTYIGFATRKLGDVDGALPFYAAALERNPSYNVARAYLGEAWLSKGQPAKAKSELSEIAARCGTSCAEYTDLSGHIARYAAAKG